MVEDLISQGGLFKLQSNRTPCQGVYIHKCFRIYIQKYSTKIVISDFSLNLGKSNGTDYGSVAKFPIRVDFKFELSWSLSSAICIASELG
jgi:hypothetical protein